MKLRMFHTILSMPYAKDFGDHAYSYHALMLWIALPGSIRCAWSRLLSERPLRPMFSILIIMSLYHLSG